MRCFIAPAAQPRRVNFVTDQRFQSHEPPIAHIRRMPFSGLTGTVCQTQMSCFSIVTSRPAPCLRVLVRELLTRSGSMSNPNSYRTVKDGFDNLLGYFVATAFCAKT